MDLYEKIMDLFEQGYYCGQIIAMLVNESVGVENPGLVRAMEGLIGGIGYSGLTCGCMVAGACAISSVGGKGCDEEEENPNNIEAVREFAAWFKEEAENSFGGCNCSQIAMGSSARKMEICPGLIADTYTKVMEILDEKDML